MYLYICNNTKKGSLGFEKDQEVTLVELQEEKRRGDDKVIILKIK